MNRLCAVGNSYSNLMIALMAQYSFVRDVVAVNLNV